MKHCLIGLTSLLLHLYAICQSSKVVSDSAALRRICSRGKWLPHQYIEVSFEKRGILGYCAVSKEALANSDSLRIDAGRLAATIATAMEDTLAKKQYLFGVHYFDRTLYTVGNGKIWTFALRRNKVVKPMEEFSFPADTRAANFINYHQLEKLRSFPLAPNQFLIPILNYHAPIDRDQNSVRYDAVALINIEQDLNQDFEAESKRQFLQLKKYIIPGGRCKRILVRFQSIVGPDIIWEHLYRLN